MSSNTIKLIINSKTFDCDKSELTKRSEYFSAMFSHEFVEKTKQEIVLNDVDQFAFQFILEEKLMNSCLDIDQVLTILKTSSMLQFNQQVTEYEAFILNNSFLNRPIRVMKECYLFPDLHEKSYAYCLWYFNELKDTQDFINIPFDCLVNYLDNAKLRTDSEMKVFDALCHWYNSNKDCNAMELLKIIRYRRLTDKELQVIVKSKIFNSLFSLQKEKINCNDNFLKVISKVLMCSEDGLLDKVRKNPGIPCFIFYTDREIILNYHLSGSKLEETKLTHELITENFVGCSFVTVGFKLFLFGGEKRLGNGHYNMDVWSYDFLIKKWQIECRMNEQRRHFSTAVLNDDVYLICGTGKYRKLLSSIVKFNIKTKNWSFCANLPNMNSLPPAVCSYRNKIYIFDSNYKLHCYDPVEDSLSQVPLEITNKPNNKPLYYACYHDFICIYKDSLYLVRKENAFLYKLNIKNWFKHSSEPPCKKHKSQKHNKPGPSSGSSVIRSTYKELVKFSFEGAYILLDSYIYRFGPSDNEPNIIFNKYNIETQLKSSNLAACDYPTKVHLMSNQQWVGILPGYLPF